MRPHPDPHPDPGRAHREQAQALPVVLLLLLVLGVALLTVTATAERAVTRAQAQQAADAAALAGAAGGRHAADRLARANGAVLAEFDQRDGTVTVEVRIGDVAAVARATGAWVRCETRDPCGTGSVP